MKEFIVERLYEEERRERIIEPGAPRANGRTVQQAAVERRSAQRRPTRP